MSPDRIKQLLSEKPFQTFTVVTGDGGEVNVLSPEFAWLRPGGRTLVVDVPRVRNAKDESEFESHTVDVFLITKVISPVRRNGKKKH